MHILLLTGEFPPQQGGVGDYTSLLAHALNAQGHHVAILTTHGPPLAPDDLPVATVPRWDWRAWSTVRAAIERVQPDVVLIQYQTAAYGLHPAINFLPGWLRLRLRGRSPCLITTFHDLKFPYLFPKAGPLRLAAVRWLARQSDAAIATNMEDWQTLQEWGLSALDYGQAGVGEAPRSPLTVMIPIGSNIACAPPATFEREAWRARLGVQPQDWLLCYFGFLNASKGGEVLINALAHLVQQGRPAHLVMIGGQVGSSDPTNQGYLTHVRQQISELALHERVHWTGFVSPAEVSAHFLAADLCVLPYQDGAGRSRGSLMAALAHGLPIVTTQPHNPLPGFQDGVNLRFVPPADPAALATAATDIMTDPALAARLAAGARALSEQFTWSALAAQHTALFAACLAQRSGGAR
jgi:glycosyltransferase involved in cell wall biosynthesis